MIYVAKICFFFEKPIFPYFFLISCIEKVRPAPKEQASLWFLNGFANLKLFSRGLLSQVDSLLLDASLLTRESTEVIQLGATNLTDFIYGNALDSG